MREAMVQVKGIKKVSVLKQTQKFRNNLSKEEVTMHSLACHIDNPEQKRIGHVY